MERLLLVTVAIATVIGLLQTFIGIFKWFTPQDEKRTWWDYRQLWINEVNSGNSEVGNTGSSIDSGENCGGGDTFSH